MEIKHYYLHKKNERLKAFLNKYNISYTEDWIKSEKVYLFEILESDIVYKNVKKFFPLTWDRGFKVLYSKQEIEAAQWLVVKNSTEKVIADIPYEDACFEKACPYSKIFSREIYYRHHKQIDLLSVDTINKFKNRFFCGIDWGNQNYLFCSEKAKILLGEKWGGLEFWNIKKRTTNKEVEGIYQMFFRKQIPLEAFVFDDFGRMKTCSGCGKNYIYTTKAFFQIKLRKEYVNNIKNVYSTGYIFSDGQQDYEYHIVPHSFYEFCEINKMNKGMVYEPILLV